MISKNEEITISDGKRELSGNIGRSYTWNYTELKDEAVETITSYNEFLERVPYYYREKSKSKRGSGTIDIAKSKMASALKPEAQAPTNLTHFP